jgi:hypothetical protein
MDYKVVKIMLTYNMCWAAFELIIIAEKDNDRFIFNGEIWEKLSFNRNPQTHGIILSKDVLQELSNDLWNSDIIPLQSVGSSGQLKATQDHVNDLRKIAFKQLGIVE